MKKRIIFALITAIIFSSAHLFAQDKPVVPDSSLFKKYEALKKNLERQIELLADAKAKYLGQYLENNNKLVTTYNTIEALAKEERQRLKALQPKKENTN